MTGLTSAPSWDGTSSDPADEQFGDVVEPVENIREEGGACDAILVGEPFDRGVIGRKGAAQAPHAIRRALASVKTHHFDAGPVGRIGDAGDVFLSVDTGDELPGTVNDLQNRLRTVSGYLHDADTVPVFVGGDNSLTYANVAPLLDRDIGVVNLDAHLDVREVRDDATSGTPYRQLIDEGLDAYACVGARHFETSSVYHDYVREQGGEVVTAEEVADDVVAAADCAIEAMGDVDSIYLSLDCDVVEMSSAPGVSAPTPGGLTTRECFRLLRLLASDDRMCGFEVVECAPPLDRDGLTVAFAARAIAHVLATQPGGGS